MLCNLRSELLCGEELIGNDSQRLGGVVQLIFQHTGSLSQSGSLGFVFSEVFFQSFNEFGFVFCRLCSSWYSLEKECEREDDEIKSFHGLIPLLS